MILPEPLLWEGPGSGAIRPGSLIFGAPFVHLDDNLRLCRTIGNRLVLLSPDEIVRWNEGDLEASIFCRGKLRKAIVLRMADDGDNWWLLPVFGDYGQRAYPLNMPRPAIVRFPSAAHVGLESGYVDFRQAALVHQSVLPPLRVDGHLAPRSVVIVRAAMAAYVRGRHHAET